MKVFILAVIAFATNVHAIEIIKAVPGKALGEVTIGTSAAGLRKIGFLPDKSRASNSLAVTYLMKGNFLARLRDDKVVQIWLSQADLNGLRINGKSLPTKLSSGALKKVFSNCENYQGSGGNLMYCESRGIEFAFPGSEGSIVKFPRFSGHFFETNDHKQGGFLWPRNRIANTLKNSKDKLSS